MKDNYRLISSSGKQAEKRDTNNECISVNNSGNLKNLNQELRYKKTTNVRLRKINSFHHSDHTAVSYGNARRLSLHDSNRNQQLNRLGEQADCNQSDRLVNYKARDMILEELRNIADRYQQYEYKRYLTYDLDQSKADLRDEHALEEEVNNYFNEHRHTEETETLLRQTSAVSKDGAQVLETESKPNEAKNYSTSESQTVKPVDPSAHYANGINLSFCGCGFLGIYHIGVASCFHLYAPQLAMQQVSGSSVGALVAVAYICGNLQLAYCTTDILSVAIKARSRALGPFHPSFDIQALVRKALECGLPHDVHERSNGKLHISLTRYSDGTNVIVNKFDSKEEVIQALLCSCFIPFWSGLVAPKFKGVTYIDGGFSNNTLVLNDRTVTVSPFAGESDICPQDDFLNLFQLSISNTSFSVSPGNIYRLSHALLPPAPEVLSDLCEQGFADGIRFLQKMKLISCIKCLEIRSSLLVTKNGEDMAEAFTAAEDECSSSGRADRRGRSRHHHRHHNPADEGDLVASLPIDNHHIRLEQQEQKKIEINECELFCSMGNGDQATKNTDSAPSRSTTATYATNAKDQNNNHPNFDVDGSSTAKPDVALENDDDVKCHECRLIRSHALVGPLPVQFRDRIKDACDLVNKSLSNWLYSYRPIKYLSYLVAPYYMPLDVSIALLMRLWQEMPSLKSEMMNCLRKLASFIVNISEFIRTNKSSAANILFGSMGTIIPLRNQQNYVNRVVRIQSTSEGGSLVIGGRGSVGGGGGATISVDSNDKASVSDTRSEPADDGASAATTPLRVDNSKAEPDACKRRDPASQVASSPIGDIQNTSSLQHTLTSLGGKNLDKEPASRQPPAVARKGNNFQQLHSLEDTFDSIVDVTHNQEARIFAYYFRDAKNRLQVTEIFDLERASDLQQQSKRQP